MERVQATEWIPPLNAADREMHRKARVRLQEQQEEEVQVPENRLQYGDDDPLPVGDWVPSVYHQEQGEAMYRRSMTHGQPYVDPVHQFFYRYYGPDLNAEQVAICAYSGVSPALVKKPFSWLSGYSHSVP